MKLSGLNKHFFLTTLLCLLGTQLFSQEKLPKPFLTEGEEGLVYNTAFQYKSYHTSGILVMKKEEQGYHLVLLSKMGPSIMDFIITDAGVIWNKKIEAIDKPMVVKAIEKDFRALLLTPLDDPNKMKAKGSDNFKVKKKITIAVKTDENNKVKAVETKSFVNLFKTFVKYYYTDEDALPDEMCLTHRNIKLKISLNQLEQ